MLISLPYFVLTGKKEKRFYVNLNIYRNAHHFTLNSAKVTFKEIVQDQIDRLPLLNRIKLHYRVFAPSNRKIDTMNVGSIADKFFCDALVESGKISDDNYDFVVYNGFEFGGIDKENLCVEVSIEETAPMKMIFGTSEIVAALQMYANQVMKHPITDPEILLESIDGGFQASLDIAMPSPSVLAQGAPKASTMTRTEQSATSSRAAITEALKATTKQEEPKGEEAKAEPKPTLLKGPEAPADKPATRSLMKPKAAAQPEPEPETQAAISTGEERVDPAQVEEAAATDEVVTTEVPTETVTTPAGSTEPTADAFAGVTTETTPKQEEAAPVTSGIGGAVKEPNQAVKSIFSFKNKS